MGNYMSFEDLTQANAADETRRTVNHSQLHEIVRSFTHEIVDKQTNTVFQNCLNQLHKVCKDLVVQGMATLAYDLLDYFRAELMVQQHHPVNQGVREFVEHLNFSEVYHNLAFLKFILGDTDSAFYYFASADQQYSLHRSPQTDSYTMMLLRTPGMPFERIIKQVCVNCSGMGWFRDFEYKRLFDTDLQPDRFIDLFHEFSLPQVYQFILTNKRFWDSYSLGHNTVKALIMTRLFGELAWILESYLRPILKPARRTFHPCLTKLLTAHPRELKEFDSIHTTMKGSRDDNEVVKNLLSMFQQTSYLPTKRAVCLYISLTIRNHTSHNLDEGFLVFQDDEFTKKIYMTQLLSYFVARSLLSRTGEE